MLLLGNFSLYLYFSVLAFLIFFSPELFVCRFVDLNLRALMLSSILVSNCPALHRINITSDSLQVCLVIMSVIFCSHARVVYYSSLNDGLRGNAEITIAKAG